jgi:hypothetical protein
MATTRRALVHSRWRPFVVLSFLTLVAFGCERKGDVSGKVTYKNKPLVFGTVQFEGKDGIIRSGNIERDGSYTVSGVATGETKVAVSSRNPKSSDFTPLQREGGPKLPPRPDYPGWFPIPEKYELTFKSGLIYAIKSGANTINIELE